MPSHGSSNRYTDDLTRGADRRELKRTYVCTTYGINGHSEAPDDNVYTAGIMRGNAPYSAILTGTWALDSSREAQGVPKSVINRHQIPDVSSSIAPVFSPLVCPEGWNTVMNRPNGYIACCASDFRVGQTVKVTAYDSASVTATVDWVASATNDQAYAHPIDGFRMESIPLSSTTQVSEGGISGGGIAGAVVGSVVGLISILFAVLFIVRRHQRKKILPSYGGGDQYTQQQHGQQQQWVKEHPGSHQSSSNYIQSPDGSVTGIFADRNYAYQTGPRYELGGSEPRELDAGWAGRELPS
ncbi:hypothetical protein AAE478_002831 [Parahypoxylon ruwenzoriense]